MTNLADVVRPLMVCVVLALDHPNTIEKLHFKVVVPFVGPFFASSRQRRTATAD
jgi:hypothetical protein